MRVLEHCFAKLKDGGEVLVHLSLELLDLQVGELTFGVVENLLREHFQDTEAVLADVDVVGRNGANIFNEGGPGVVPLILHNLYEDAVALGQDVLHSLLQIVDLRIGHHHADYEGLELGTLITRQRHPFLLSNHSFTLIASSSRTSM